MIKQLSRFTATTDVKKTDVKNQKLLQALAQDGRVPATELAHALRLSRDAVSYRINKLTEEGILVAVCPTINLEAFGQLLFHVFFLLDEKARLRHSSFTTYLSTHSHTLSVKKYTDTWDLEWIFVAPDLRTCDSILQMLIADFGDVVLEKEVLAEVKQYIHRNYPGTHIQKTKTFIGEIDTTDKAVLQELAKDSRQSTYSLAKKLHVSSDTVAYRTRKLVHTGFIKGFSGVYDLAKRGYTWYTYAMQFDRLTREDEAKLAECAQQNPNILYASKTFGHWDVLLTIVAQNPQEYHALVKYIKNTFANIITSYQTWLANEEVVYIPVPRVLIDKTK